jgi:hypothetical protein
LDYHSKQQSCEIFVDIELLRRIPGAEHRNIIFGLPRFEQPKSIKEIRNGLIVAYMI